MDVNWTTWCSPRVITCAPQKEAGLREEGVLMERELAWTPERWVGRDAPPPSPITGPAKPVVGSSHQDLSARPRLHCDQVQRDTAAV